MTVLLMLSATAAIVITLCRGLSQTWRSHPWQLIGHAAAGLLALAGGWYAASDRPLSAGLVGLAAAWLICPWSWSGLIRGARPSAVSRTLAWPDDIWSR
ncbi:MAG: hypothetical protein RIQ53_4178 [Pseudomonadota bacterium]|jgi:hypothetical protein